ncbi:MAG: restriction endonuclease [Deltaproteobacteria bacterium]|nr:restriction endonuclease [Deltaproteobacteria bacterium]
MENIGYSLDIIFQYPPDLLGLLTEVLPRLCKTKKDLLLFFQGAGVSHGLLSPYEALLKTKRESFKKHIVTQEILKKLNELGERSLRKRRELLKRVTEFQDFSVCWEPDQAPARGLVAQIRELVNVKDSFTRINLEREYERKQRLAEETRKAEVLRKRQQEFQEIKQGFFALFGEPNPYKRGKAVEAVLNRYFKYCGISVSEAITLKGDAGSGIIEQIDGVVQIRGQLFLVEVKWEQEALGRDKVASHLVRVFSRGLAGGIFISYSDYSAPAILDCKEALRDKVIILCKLDEFFHALEREMDLIKILHDKIDAAVIHKNPLLSPTL